LVLLEIPLKRRHHVSITQCEGDHVTAKYAWINEQQECYGNAPCESWFVKLKAEWIYPKGIDATRREAELLIIEYIEMFYNSRRLHQALDYRPPNEVEAEYFADEKIDINVD